MKVLAIARANLLRLTRDRTALFFVFLLPMLLILVIGAAFGGGFNPRIAVLDLDGGPLAANLVDDLEAIDNARISEYPDRATILSDLRRDDLEAGVVIQAGYDQTLGSGGTATIEYIAVPSGSGFEVQSLVESVVAAQSARVRAARFIEQQTGAGFETALGAAGAAGSVVEGVEVQTVGPDGGPPAIGAGQFDFGAAQELILFMFITSLTGSAALIQSRRLGVSRRMLSTPTGVGEIITGETLGRFGVVMVQGIFIVVAAALLFGVDWGNWVATIAIVVAFSLVGTGAGVLMGSTFRNEEQAGGIAVFSALALGALGGCMVPLEIFPESVRRVAHVTPHAWAVDGLSEIIRRHGGIGDVAVQLAVLLGFAAVLTVLAVWRLRRALTS